jgi:cell division protein FtsQ
MAEDYSYSEETVASAPSRFEKLLKGFIIFAILCLAGELTWLLGISPLRPFSRIDVSGYEGMGREEILVKAGITPNTSYFSSDVEAMESALMKISSLESARVFKFFPGRLKIVLEGRRPVAAALASLDGRIVPVIFDSQGVIFEIGGKDGSFSGILPVISGLVITEPVPGMKLPGLFVPFFKELEKIEMSAPELLGAISEIKINRKAFDGFDLVLYPVHKKIKVRLSELNEDMLRYTLLMIDVLESNENGVDSLDFRSGIASYIPKEASSE